MCDVKKMFTGLDGKASKLLLHLILLADENGNIETSERTLARDLYMGRQEVRTAKQHLLSTQRVTQQVTQGKTTITLCCCGGCRASKTTKQPNRQPNRQPTSNPVLPFDIAPEWVAEEYATAFLDWLEYKRSRRESYKNEKSMMVCYNRLVKLSNGNPDTARLVVEQSMANGWKGLFPLNENNNGTTDRRSNGRDDELAAQAIRMRSYFEAERVGR